MSATALLTRWGHERLGRSVWGFRTVRFNLAGRLAVLVPGGLLGAGIGMLSRTLGSRNPRRVLVLGVAGAVTGLLLARIADQHRWRGSVTSLQLDEPDEALDLMQAIRAAGVDADMIKVDDHAHPDLGGFVLRYHARDGRRVRAVLTAQRG